MKIKDFIAKTLRVGTFLSFTALLVTVVLQIVSRFLLSNVTFVWTEELSRFLFIYSVAFGAPLAMKNQEYINVDILLEKLPKKSRYILEAIIEIAAVGLFIIVFVNSIEFLQIGSNQTSATLGIPMSVAYFSITMTSALIVLYGVINVINKIRFLIRRDDIV
ncbi:TRAP transporter small permease [Senegalia massiliensis]|nr:TRAP transporter small permease [Senegalia massiliensis]